MSFNFFGTNNPISFGESSSGFHKRNNDMGAHTTNFPKDHGDKFGNYKSSYGAYSNGGGSSSDSSGKLSFMGSWKRSEPMDTLSFEDRLNNQFAWITGTTPYDSKDWS